MWRPAVATTLSHINRDSEERIMNSYWANEQARQRIQQMRRDAAGDVLVRGSRADLDAPDGPTATARTTPIRQLGNVLVRRAGRLGRVAVP
jgi:hypothetical protein